MPAQEWLPWVVPSGTSVLVSTFVLLMYRGRVVSKTEVDRVERVYEKMLSVYKDAHEADKTTIDKLSVSLEKMSDAQRTTNSLIQGISNAAEVARGSRQGST